ncbi:MAG: YdcF family protein [Candidatus Pristimantibacillus lignocellulolyticus]|uniref:YdcF family protein n=1 Tax=Candidatus Pristimantibacillus lignocellulolyticus TaxID=2994561 RepID=A0A9J6ZBC0_9BACL|nr:MAG: YdcF family protein [Candidatus Pristimantibacillus lignocellulolyticus]
MTKKLKLKLAITIIASFLIFVIYSGVSIWTFGNQVQLVKTDVAVVLGAAAWDSEPSPVLRERVNHSIWLYENGYVGNIIFTGGKGSGAQYSESEVAREYAILHHVNPEHIFIETKSKITEENLTYAYEIAAENNFTRFTIVSDPLHMKRAMLMAEQTGMDAFSSPTQSSAFKSLKSKIPFFLRELFFYIGYIASMPFR